MERAGRSGEIEFTVIRLEVEYEAECDRAF